MIKRGLLLVLLLTVFVSAGCGKQDIRQTAIVLGIAIDSMVEENPEEIQITLEVADFGPRVEKSSGDFGSSLFSASGSTIAEALGNLSRLLSKEMFLGHTQCLIIGEGAAKAGIRDYLEYFYLQGALSPGLKLLCAQGQGRELLQGAAGMSAFASLGLFRNLELQNSSPPKFVQALSLQEYREQALMPQAAILMPQAYLIPHQALADGEEEKDQALNLIQIKGMGVFGQDGRLKGIIEEEMAAGALLWLNKGKNILLMTEEGGSKASAILNQWRIKPAWQLTEAGLALHIQGRGEAVLEEGDFLSAAQGAWLKARLEQKAEALLHTAFQQSVEMGEDFLLLGESLMQKDFSLWKTFEGNWMEMLADLPIEYDIQLKLLPAMGEQG